MKRILFLLAMLTFPASLFGQGQVGFANTSATLFTTNLGGQTGPINGVNTWRIGLYTAPSGTMTESLFTLIAVATNSPLFPGRFSYPENPLSISGNNGTPIAYQIKLWALAAGPSYEAAIASALGLVGKSPIGQVTPAVGGQPPPSLFSSIPNLPEFPGQLTSGVAVIGIPEPSIYALAVVATMLLVCFRGAEKLFPK